MEIRERALLTITIANFGNYPEESYYAIVDGEGEAALLTFKDEDVSNDVLDYNFHRLSYIVDAELTGGRRPVCNVLKVHGYAPRSFATRRERGLE